MDDLIAVGKHFLKSDKHTWVHECLVELPSQLQMPFDKFTELMLELTQVRWRDVLEKNRVKMIKSPVAEWARHL